MKSGIIRLLAPGLLASALTATLAQADVWPHRKPGLWQMTVSMQGSPMGPMTSKYCIDAATEDALMSMGQNAAKSMCSKNDVHVSGMTGTIDAVCKFGNMTQTSHTVVTFTGNTAYRSETHAHMVPAPQFGGADHITVNEAKWMGPCPSDMKPGDMVMPNGMRMNMAPGGH